MQTGRDRCGGSRKRLDAKSNCSWRKIIRPSSRRSGTSGGSDVSRTRTGNSALPS